MTKNDIAADITQAAQALQEEGVWPHSVLPTIRIEETDTDTPGDYLCVFPIDVAVLLHRHPSGVVRELQERLRGDYEQISISHPGVLHFFVGTVRLAEDVQRIIEKGAKYGRTNSGRRQKVVIDCPSINPAVPMSLLDARRLYIADTLNRVLQETGYAAHMYASWEDTGAHIDRLGESVARRWMQQSGINVPFEDTLYHGDYILHLARTLDVKNYKLQNVKKIEWVKERMKTLAVRKMKASGEQFALDRMQVSPNAWFSDEEAIPTLDRLRRVIVIVSSGNNSANYIQRLQQAQVGEEVNIVRINAQDVHLVMDGARLQLEQKPGEEVSVEELTEEYDPEAVRLLFVQAAADEQLGFDLNAVADDSHGNPLIMMQDTLRWLNSYVQRAAEQGIPKNTPVELLYQEEQDVARELTLYPQMLDEIALSGQVTALTRYTVHLARSIWRLHFGIPEDNAHVKKEQVSLLRAARITLENAMRVLGLDTDIPELPKDDHEGAESE